jgi:ribosomal-protein-alanine N-acetyltransferase
MINPAWRPPILETPRLRLRPFEESDVDALFAVARNPNVTRFTLWDAHRTPDDARAFLRDCALASYLERLPDPYALVLKEGDALIGAAGARWASQKDRCMEFGYWLAEPFWGRGLAVEAGRALLNHLFASYDVERIQAHFMEGNTASGRVLEKLGLTFEGVHRRGLFHRGRFWDLHWYAVLRDEWRT